MGALFGGRREPLFSIHSLVCHLLFVLHFPQIVRKNKKIIKGALVPTQIPLIVLAAVIVMVKSLM